MSDEKIKTILESADGLTEQEWKSLRQYFDYKFSLNSRFINSELAFKTVKIFLTRTRNPILMKEREFKWKK